jgi:hypothetical protein
VLADEVDAARRGPDAVGRSAEQLREVGGDIVADVGAEHRCGQDLAAARRIAGTLLLNWTLLLNHVRSPP